MEFTQVNMPKCLLLPEVFPVFNFIQLQRFNSFFFDRLSFPCPPTQNISSFPDNLLAVEEKTALSPSGLH